MATSHDTPPSSAALRSAPGLPREPSKEDIELAQQLVNHAHGIQQGSRDLPTKSLPAQSESSSRPTSTSPPLATMSPGPAAGSEQPSSARRNPLDAGQVCRYGGHYSTVVLYTDCGPVTVAPHARHFGGDHPQAKPFATPAAFILRRGIRCGQWE